MIFIVVENQQETLRRQERQAAGILKISWSTKNRLFAVSVPERVAATVLTTENAALPVVKSIGLFGL